MHKRTLRIDCKKPQLYFDSRTEPVARIRSEETIVVKTERADSMYIHSAEDTYSSVEDMLKKQGGGSNPCTGPLSVEGAEPGDNLSVEILKISPLTDGYTCIFPGSGGLVASYAKNNLQSPLPPETIICAIEDERVLFQAKHKIIELPLTPFVGTVATAPSQQRIPTLQNGQEFLGNVDCPLICPGNVVVLPVNVEGGLLFLGDVHAIQGHGEISGAAIECGAEVTVRVKVIKKDKTKYISWPQIYSPEHIGSISCVPTTLEDALKAAYIDLILRMEQFYGFDRLDAYQLLSQVGEILVCQVVPPLYTCVAKIHRRYLV